ncbi:hypothetical protein HPB50_015013 [Hyalomma asiaticum]|uniref:Uncharacterized protein n=1 Tax=Hyalomma asiaticum TaxID=266040 RepID=A0ACB7SHA5_HYAAI|nr:hypothetical protein HPB50_015013 [Hyalomma asiaticum]
MWPRWFRVCVLRLNDCPMSNVSHTTVARVTVRSNGRVADLQSCSGDLPPGVFTPYKQTARVAGVAGGSVNRILRAHRDEGRIRDAASCLTKRTTEEEDLDIVACVSDNPFMTAGERRAAIGLNDVCTSGRKSVTVWGVITKEGLGPLHRINGRLWAEQYIIIIDHQLIPHILKRPYSGGHFVLPHDLSPIHTAHAVAAHLESLGVTTPYWPPKGAHMNITENFWGILKANLSKLGFHTATADKLWEVIRSQREERKANRDLVPALYDSLPRRVWPGRLPTIGKWSANDVVWTSWCPSDYYGQEGPCYPEEIIRVCCVALSIAQGLRSCSDIPAADTASKVHAAVVHGTKPDDRDESCDERKAGF